MTAGGGNAGGWAEAERVVLPSKWGVDKKCLIRAFFYTPIKLMYGTIKILTLDAFVAYRKTKYKLVAQTAFSCRPLSSHQSI